MNVAILMGRLTDNPELRKTANGISVTSFSLAVDRSFKTSSGERQTDFINIVAWRQTAEFCANYFRKGQLVAIEGTIQTRKYQDKEGNNRTAFEVVANQAHFAEKKRDGDSGGYQGGGNYGGNQAEPAAPSYSNANAGDFTELAGDDDLPF